MYVENPYHTLGVNNEPLQSSTCTKRRYKRLAEALQPLQLYTALQLYISTSSTDSIYIYIPLQHLGPSDSFDLKPKVF